MFFYTVTVNIDWLSNDCWDTNTKIIPPTNHNRSKQQDNPITIPSNKFYL